MIAWSSPPDLDSAGDERVLDPASSIADLLDQVERVAIGRERLASLGALAGW
jgi:hypothetical protein